ncbi:EutN/CcmL family microcompartment protein [bacterium]|nr:EutN/CcmL family microcompartment protein [bacterium]
MILARVIGSLVATIKHDSYQNRKIMLVKPISPDGQMKSLLMVAVDTVGCGVGDTVLVASEGRAAMELLGLKKRPPLRSIVTAIVDRIDYSPISPAGEPS